MPLIEVKLDPQVLERGVRSLERICQILEEYCFPRRARVDSKPAGPEALSEYDPEAEATRETENELREKMGLPLL